MGHEREARRCRMLSRGIYVVLRVEERFNNGRQCGCIEHGLFNLFDNLPQGLQNDIYGSHHAYVFGKLNAIGEVTTGEGFDTGVMAIASP